MVKTLKEYNELKDLSSLEEFMIKEDVHGMNEDTMDLSSLFLKYTDTGVLELKDIRPFEQFCEDVVEIYNSVD
jgi:hypothetical protein